jgi:hypothetical protein
LNLCDQSSRTTLARDEKLRPFFVQYEALLIADSFAVEPLPPMFGLRSECWTYAASRMNTEVDAASALDNRVGMHSVTLRASLAFAGFFALCSARAHPGTLQQHLLAQVATPLHHDSGPTISLTLEVTVDDETEPVAALVRMTALPSNTPIALPAHLRRPMNWFSLPARAAIQVPAGEVRLEVCHGLETELVTLTRSFRSGAAAHLKISLRRFYSAKARRIRSVNTHAHLQFTGTNSPFAAHLRTRVEAEEYLNTAARSDGLDFVIVSHLERANESQNYISNTFTPEILARWSDPKIRFVYGEEHRHEGGRSTRRLGPDELRYGHVLFLDLPELVRPASYGAILTGGRETGDSVPMRRAITEARDKQATIVWCHGREGTEDIPNWAAGLLHAQNIYDGGTDGTFDTVYYPYLNAGLRVPFSTGTDWGIYDFSRVYVSLPRDQTATSRTVLEQLRAGRNFITNGPFLEFTVNERAPGETLDFQGATRATIRARAIGRDQFARVELIYNGRVVAQAAPAMANGAFEAALESALEITEPGWLALRVGPTRPYNDRTQYTGPEANLFGKALFAHTSPVYITFNGQTRREPAALRTLIAGLESAIELITAKGAFVNDGERERLLAHYRDAMAVFSAHLPPQ